MNPQRHVANAKLTCSLRVIGVRPDGYHLIDAEMVSLDLADELVFEDASQVSLQVTTEGAASKGLVVTPGDDNLIARALRALERTATVAVVKRIPAGAGLGGGSSDAAAVYRWAGRTSSEDVVAAARLGADVSFCIRGGRARVTGIGESIAPLPFEERTYTLILPPFGVSTPAVYRAWDALGGPTGENGGIGGNGGNGGNGNDLELAALAVEPRLAEWRDRLGDATGVTPTLAGSGSTWFVPGAFEGDGLVVCRTVPELR